MKILQPRIHIDKPFPSFDRSNDNKEFKDALYHTVDRFSRDNIYKSICESYKKDTIDLPSKQTRLPLVNNNDDILSESTSSDHEYDDDNNSKYLSDNDYENITPDDTPIKISRSKSLSDLTTASTMPDILTPKDIVYQRVDHCTDADKRNDFPTTDSNSMYIHDDKPLFGTLDPNVFKRSSDQNLYTVIHDEIDEMKRKNNEVIDWLLTQQNKHNDHIPCCDSCCCKHHGQTILDKHNDYLPCCDSCCCKHHGQTILDKHHCHNIIKQRDIAFMNLRRRIIWTFDHFATDMVCKSYMYDVFANIMFDLVSELGGNRVISTSLGGIQKYTTPRYICIDYNNIDNNKHIDELINVLYDKHHERYELLLDQVGIYKDRCKLVIHEVIKSYADSLCTYGINDCCDINHDEFVNDFYYNVEYRYQQLHLNYTDDRNYINEPCNDMYVD